MKYEYIKSPIDLAKIESEIRSALPLQILVYSESYGDSFSVNFSEPLSLADKATLDSVVENHVVPQDSAELIKQRNNRAFGDANKTSFIDEIGEKVLALKASSSMTSGLIILEEISKISFLLESGYLDEAKEVCLSLIPVYTDFAAILQDLVDKIDLYFTE